LAFRGISGSHDGANLARYFVGLCERVGIITATECKVFCFVLVFWIHRKLWTSYRELQPTIQVIMTRLVRVLRGL
jgi:hypothetical protein